LREECRLRVYENRVLRRILGLKRRKLREELSDLHSSLHVFR